MVTLFSISHFSSCWVGGTPCFLNMANYTHITKKHWREFFASMQEGETCVFDAESAAEISVIRAVASKVNTQEGLPYKFSVEGNNESLKVRITTKRPL